MSAIMPRKKSKGSDLKDDEKHTPCRKSLVFRQKSMQVKVTKNLRFNRLGQLLLEMIDEDPTGPIGRPTCTTSSSLCPICLRAVDDDEYFMCICCLSPIHEQCRRTCPCVAAIYVSQSRTVPEDTEVELAIDRERHASYLFTFVPTWPFRFTFNRVYTMLSMLEVNERCKVQLSTRKLSLPPTNFHDRLWHGTSLEAVNNIWLDNGCMIETKGKGKRVGVWASPDLNTAGYYGYTSTSNMELLKGKFFLSIIELVGDGNRSTKRFRCRGRPQWCMPSDSVCPLSVFFWRVHSTKAQRKGRPDIIDLKEHVDV